MCLVKPFSVPILAGTAQRLLVYIKVVLVKPPNDLFIIHQPNKK